MAPPDEELVTHLVEAGNKLLQPPSSVDEILSLLDLVENHLSRVEQSPSIAMQTALSPSVKALVADELLRHSDVDVKVSVASCISEITRITAPDAPYDDERMKDIFHLIVSSFENLSDTSSRSYNKRTLILETVAKVRSCVVMLDLECDGLIVEMFQHFLKAIRDDHPDNVFSSMETIMTDVLDESEDISLELISPILASVESDNQEVLPIARKLGEKVIESCALKLKPYLTKAMKSLGLSLDDHSKVIASICNGTTDAAIHNDDNACGEQLADENKLAMASPDEASKDQLTKGSTSETRPEGDNLAEDRSPKSVMSNVVAEGGYEDRMEDAVSSKKVENAHQTDRSGDTNITSNAEPNDSNSGKIVKSDTMTEETLKKRGKQPKSAVNSTEPPDSSQVDSDKEAERTADHEKSHSKEVHSSPSEGPSVEMSVHPECEKEDVQLASPKALDSVPMDVASPSPSVPGESCPKKGGRPKKNDNLIKEVAPSTDVDGASASEQKPQRCSGKKAHVGHATDEKTPALGDEAKTDGGTSSDSEAKPLKQCVRKVNERDSMQDGSSLKKEAGKKRGLGKATFDNDLRQSSSKDEDREKSHSKEVHSSPSEGPSVEMSVHPESEKEDVQLSSPKALEDVPMDVASRSPSENVPGESRPKKGGRPKKNDNLIKEVASSPDVDGASESEQKPQACSSKKTHVGRATDEKTPALGDESKTDGGTTSDSEAKTMKQCVRKVNERDSMQDGSSLKKEAGKKRGCGKATSENDLRKSSSKDDDKEVVPSSKTATKVAKVEDHPEETLKTSSKRECNLAKERESDEVEYGPNLIGSNVKVWWPADEKFYVGSIVSFDRVKKKHKVLYTDGEVEVLNLRMEKWEFVRDDSMLDAEQATECQSPDSSTEMHKRKKAKTNSEPLAKQGKMEGSRGGEASSSKSKGAAAKTGRKSRIGGTSEGNAPKSGDKSEDASGSKSKGRTKKGSGKSIGDGSRTDGKSKYDGATPKTGTKSKAETRKTDSKDSPKSTTKGTLKTKGKAAKSGNKSNANGSGRRKSGTARVNEIEGEEESPPEMVKSPESADEGMSPDAPSKGKKTGAKSGKKRKRGRAKH